MSKYAQSETIGAASAAIPGALAPLTTNPVIAIASALIGPILGLFRRAGRRRSPAVVAAATSRASRDAVLTQPGLSPKSARTQPEKAPGKSPSARRVSRVRCSTNLEIGGR